MCGCYLRTAAGAVLLTLCALCWYVKCVGASVLLTLCSLCLYFKWVGAPYGLLSYGCILWCYRWRLCILYAVFFSLCMLNDWGIFTHCSLRSGPYACISNAVHVLIRYTSRNTCVWYVMWNGRAVHWKRPFRRICAMKVSIVGGSACRITWIWGIG